MLTCFLLEPTGLERVSLRRYAGGPCALMPGEHGYHNAHFELGDHSDGTANRLEKEEAIGRDDPRWPKICGCGYAFAPEDRWQVFSRHLWRRADDPSIVTTLHDAAPGAMWPAVWFLHDADPTAMRAKWPRGAKAESYLSSFYWHDHAGKRAPITVKCPNGREWMVDAVSSNGAGWEVKGKAPRITCSPSIALPGYHGFLRDGVFTDDVEGRGPMGRP